MTPTQKRYSGTTQEQAQDAFEADRDAMEEQGYVVTDTTWTKEDRRFMADLHHLDVTYGPEEEWTGVRFYPSGTVRVKVTTPEEAKQAIRELKDYKKELAIQKKELSAEAAAIRATQAQKVSSRGGLVRGSGSRAKAVRGLQRASRDAQKSRVASQIGAIAQSKTAIDRLSIEIE